MRDSCWLIFTKRGLRGASKGKRTRYGDRERPALKAGEYAVRISVNVPDKVFEDRPIPEATITIPPEAVIEPVVTVLEPSEDQ